MTMWKALSSVLLAGQAFSQKSKDDLQEAVESMAVPFDVSSISDLHGNLSSG